jgi:hypothetical protein
MSEFAPRLATPAQVEVAEGVVPLSRDQARLLDLYREAVAASHLAQRQVTELRNQILALGPGSSWTGVYRDHPLVEVRQNSRTVIDTEALKRDWPEVWRATQKLQRYATIRLLNGGREAS